MTIKKLTNLTKVILTIVFVMGTLTLAPLSAFAAPAPSVGCTTGTNCVDTIDCSKGDRSAFCGDAASSCANGDCDIIKNYVNPAIVLVSGIVGLVVAASIIYGSILYVSSSGDPQKVAKAKGHIIKTVVALVAYIFLYSFLQFILPGGILHRAT